MVKIKEMVIQTIFGLPLFDIKPFYYARRNWYHKKFNMERWTEIHHGVKIFNFHDDLFKGYIKFGKNCSIGWDVLIDYSGGIIIGNNVRILHEARIYTHEHIYKDKNILLHSPAQKSRSIGLKIGDDSLIGEGSFILAQVKKIGKGAIIGARSVVTKDVERYTIVAGNPAKKIGLRN